MAYEQAPEDRMIIARQARERAMATLEAARKQAQAAQDRVMYWEERVAALDVSLAEAREDVRASLVKP